jgi:hypothetical protein
VIYTAGFVSGIWFGVLAYTSPGGLTNAAIMTGAAIAGGSLGYWLRRRAER